MARDGLRTSTRLLLAVANPVCTHSLSIGEYSRTVLRVLRVPTVGTMGSRRAEIAVLRPMNTRAPGPPGQCRASRPAGPVPCLQASRASAVPQGQPGQCRASSAWRVPPSASQNSSRCIKVLAATAGGEASAATAASASPAATHSDAEQSAAHLARATRRARIHHARDTRRARRHPARASRRARMQQAQVLSAGGRR